MTAGASPAFATSVATPSATPCAGRVEAPLKRRRGRRHCPPLPESVLGRGRLDLSLAAPGPDDELAGDADTVLQLEIDAR